MGPGVVLIGRSKRGALERFMPATTGFSSRGAKGLSICAPMHAHMTKTISLSDEAYRLLRRHKRNEESFSDVVKRLSQSRTSLLDLLDLYPELVGDAEYGNEVKAARAEIEARLG